MSTGARVRESREYLGLSVDELATMTAIPVEVLRAVEADERGALSKLSGNAILGLARALGAAVDWLLLGKVPEFPAGTPTIIVCSRGRRVHRCEQCGERASKQCDYALSAADAAKLGRQCCDAWLCARCAVVVGRDRDYCPTHPRPEPVQLTLQHERKRREP